MKELNKTSTKIMWDIIALLGDKDYMKIQNNPEDSGFMALSVEYKALNIIHAGYPDYPGKIYSLAHYYSQNGDAMSDPYMEFLCIDASANRAIMKAKDARLTDAMLDKIQWKPVFPICFEQHGTFATYQESAIIDEGKVTRYSKKLQADHASFANKWLENIKHQQLNRVKVAGPVIELFYIKDNKGVTGIYTNPNAANICKVTHARTFERERGPGAILTAKVPAKEYQEGNITVSNIHNYSTV
jgi:hypothetical protein